MCSEPPKASKIIERNVVTVEMVKKMAMGKLPEWPRPVFRSDPALFQAKRRRIAVTTPFIEME